MGEEQTNDAVDAEQLAQRYRALVEHTPDGICVHEHGVIVYVNHATARLLGARTADDLVGRPLTDFVHPESVPGMLERIGKLTTAGAASQPTEMELVRVDGGTVPVETVSVLTPWHDHYAYQVVIHDLTAQRAAEDAQRRAEQHFTAVVEQLEEGVVVIARGGVIESANPAALRIFGADERYGDLVGGIRWHARWRPARRSPATSSGSTAATGSGAGSRAAAGCSIRAIRTPLRCPRSPTSPNSAPAEGNWSTRPRTTR
ncbi:PAS domain S-box/diguanylate cyclase (GGDEF) domain-containing protein [Mycobacteroides abscessus subsp. abscessus]|nr:PAS domain S-box/diguanylate cyclase (GGDEF) domain-containing protein [Mycobacteroides abscessus subsp. abscessus]